MQRDLPNLIIAGAPKCGTTALSHYLSRHPDIFMSEESYGKELNFFNSDIRLHKGALRVRTIDEYRRIFAQAPEDTQIRGEASPLYLYSGEAASAIARTCRSAKIIIMIRRPVEIARGMHNQHAKNGLDNTTFEDAWNLQDSRAKGFGLPPKFTDGSLLQYGPIAKIGEQVERLLRYVPKDDVFFLPYDEFRKAPEVELDQVTGWLGLPPLTEREFPRINQSISYRLPWLNNSLRQLDSIRRSLRLPGGFGFHKLIDSYNAFPGKRPLEPAFAIRLQEYFEADVIKLSALVKRDLSEWLLCPQEPMELD